MTLPVIVLVWVTVHTPVIEWARELCGGHVVAVLEVIDLQPRLCLVRVVQLCLQRCYREVSFIYLPRDVATRENEFRL